jgi:hypothetical protein
MVPAHFWKKLVNHHGRQIPVGILQSTLVPHLAISETHLKIKKSQDHK